MSEVSTDELKQQLAAIREKLLGMCDGISAVGGERLETKSALVEALEEASVSGGTGEVIARQGERVGRVHFVGGEVAWVHLPGRGVSLVDQVAEQGGLGREDLEIVFKECQETGANFFDCLVSWDLLDEETVRQVVRDSFADALGSMCKWSSVRALFAPQKSTYGGSLRFSLNELMSIAWAAEGREWRPSSLPPPPNDADEGDDAPPKQSEQERAPAQSSRNLRAWVSVRERLDEMVREVETCNSRAQAFKILSAKQGPPPEADHPF